MMKERITLPPVASAMRATGTVRFVKSPSGMKLTPGSMKARRRAKGMSSTVVTMTAGIPKSTATSSPMKVVPMSGNRLAMNAFIPSDTGMSAEPSMPHMIGRM